MIKMMVVVAMIKTMMMKMGDDNEANDLVLCSSQRVSAAGKPLRYAV